MCLQHGWLKTILNSPCNQIGVNSAKYLQWKEHNDCSTAKDYYKESIHTVKDMYKFIHVYRHM